MAPDNIDSSSEFEAEKQIPLEDRVRRDFFLSFKYSQGDPDLQDFLFIVSIRQYPRERQEEIYAASAKIGKTVESFKIPQEHDPQDEDQVKSGFRQMWQHYNLVLRKILGYYKKGLEAPSKELATVLITIDSGLRDDENRLFDRILAHIIEKEIFYSALPEGRPNRYKPESDPFESHLKTYILEGQKSGSQIYDSIFRKMRAELLAVQNDETIMPRFCNPDDIGISTGQIKAGIKAGLNKLVPAWEDKHPGQKFFS